LTVIYVMSPNLVRATHDYEMQSYDEISFSKGSIIAVKTAPESGRWTGYVVDSLGPNKQEGIFYRTFVSLLQRVDSSRAQGNVLFLGERLPLRTVLRAGIDGLS
jgi:Variant SH3 domain